MENLLVTGANGFIGKNLILSKSLNRYDTYCTYFNTRSNNTKNNKKNYIRINLLDFKEYSKLPNHCHNIIHLAGDARTFVDKKSEKKQILHNTKITKNLLWYAKKAKCKKIIFLSSVYVYSGSKNKIYKENIKLRPEEALGKSKLISEKLIKEFVKTNKTQCYILRAFTIYGPNYRKSQFLPMIKDKINNKKNKKIFLKNPFIKRDFLHVSDLIEAINLCLKKKKSKKLNIFNVGSGKSLSVGFIVKKLLQISNKKKELIFSSNEKIIKFSGDKDHYANIDSIRNILNWRAKLNISKGLKKFYEQNAK